ncbi:hypothetical protein VMCG_10847 [Cytospora schulzeri]|uniref:Rhodopsin domain-containing protein n=1 Tax=Cytospora schulzeri TaxID=448051 RepID=A0A423V8S6_9PEZI|nr:hypothetical protein VMCG_10847 [Valsa malicola]
MAAIASEYLADVLEPERFAAAIFGVTVAFTVLSTNVVGLRTWVRRRQLSHDDYLMCTALVVNLVHNAIVMHGTFVGIGSPDSRLNTELVTEGKKAGQRYPRILDRCTANQPQYLFLWQMFYAIDLVCLKTSILTTLKRIDKERRFIYVLWGLIVLVSILSVAAVITLLARCQPIQANWDGTGTCINSNVFVALAKTAYVFDVLSDLAMAIISTLLLWAPEMRLGSKILTGLALGLGVVASIASVLRTVYTNAYSSHDDYLYNTGKIVLWTVVECGTGIIAGSLPMLGLFSDIRQADKKWDELEFQYGQGMPQKTTAGRYGRRSANPSHP